MTVRIGDSKYFTALIELLQAQGESDIPIELDAAKLGLTIAVPVDELFTKAFRTKIRDWSLDVVESSGETTLAAIAQNATSTQLNLSLGDGLNNGETFDLLAFDLYARLATFNAGDRAEIFWALETGIRGAFPVIGARNPGLIKHTRGWVAIDTDQLVDRTRERVRLQLQDQLVTWNVHLHHEISAYPRELDVHPVPRPGDQRRRVLKK